MRKYESIWNKLKETGTAALSAPISQHPTIRQAVIKEKCLDIAHSMLLLDKGEKYDLVIHTEGKLMRFSFKPTIQQAYRL